MKLSLPFLVFTVLTTTTVVADKEKVRQSKKLRGDKNVLRNQDDKLDARPSKVNSDRDLESTRIVGGTQADNGEYPYFGESVQSARRLKCCGFAFISSQKNRERPQK
jgi:hypothetical protein